MTSFACYCTFGVHTQEMRAKEKSRGSVFVT